MKKIIGFVLVVWLAVAGAMPAFAGPPIYMDDTPVVSDVSPYIRDGRTMVPIRFISEHLGAEVTWIDEERRVSIYLPAYDLHVGMTVGVWDMVINGTAISYDEPVCEITDGRTFVPLRFVADAFGCNTVWTGDSVEITTPVSVPMDFDVYESVRSFIGLSKQALEDSGHLTPMFGKDHTYVVGAFEFNAFFDDEGICHAMHIPVNLLAPEAPAAAILTDDMADAVCGIDMPPFTQLPDGSYQSYVSQAGAWDIALMSPSPIQTVDNTTYYCFVLEPTVTPLP